MERVLVFRHADEFDLRPSLALESDEVVLHEGLGQFSGAIGSKVEEQNPVTVADERFVGIAPAEPESRSAE